MSLNSVDYLSQVATPHLPRTKAVVAPYLHKRPITCKHGYLIPWYARFVYPHSNLKMDMSCFVRMDTSIKVPLDDVFMDNYFFFVPIRILDKNFEKILGHKPPYDTNEYNFSLMDIDTDSVINHDSLIQYLGYGHYDAQDGSPWFVADLTSKNWKVRSTSGTEHEYINPYLLAAYYKVWNEFFRDENLDAEKPIDDLLDPNGTSYYALSTNSIWKNLEVLPVNRYFDLFSSGLLSPVKGGNGDVVIPMGTPLVPVITGNMHDGNVGNPLKFRKSADDSSVTGNRQFGWSYTDGMYVGAVADTPVATAGSVMPANLWADVESAAPSVRQLYLSLALYQLYDKRGTFGTRLIEQIRGSFGLEVPDGLLDRAEYLGGSNQSLNNIPVLNTADDLGEMRGNSATITGLNSFDKGFNEWGIVLGVSCFRIKHVYGEGISNPVFKMFSNLDMYWPEFANIGKVAVKSNRIANNPGTANNERPFNYNEPWLDERMEIDYPAGDFGSFRDPNNNDLATKWSYQDIYRGRPTFNADWLKEPGENVKRTLTSLLIPGSTLTEGVGQDPIDGHQYMVRYNYHIELTMPIPTRSEVPNITGRI